MVCPQNLLVLLLVTVSFDPVVQKMGRVTPEVTRFDRQPGPPDLRLGLVAAGGGSSHRSAAQLPAKTLIIHNDRQGCRWLLPPRSSYVPYYLTFIQPLPLSRLFLSYPALSLSAPYSLSVYPTSSLLSLSL
jgi:hypothetical protein